VRGGRRRQGTHRSGRRSSPPRGPRPSSAPTAARGPSLSRRTPTVWRLYGEYGHRIRTTLGDRGRTGTHRGLPRGAVLVRVRARARGGAGLSLAAPRPHTGLPGGASLPRRGGRCGLAVALGGRLDCQPTQRLSQPTQRFGIFMDAWVGNRRFGLLSTLHAHTKPPTKPIDCGDRYGRITTPGPARTVLGGVAAHKGHRLGLPGRGAGHSVQITSVNDY
jgi:hypothetical protein